MSAIREPSSDSPATSVASALPSMRRRRSLYVTADDDLASVWLARREAQEYRLAEAWTNTRDGSLLRLIPGGEFSMGSSPEEIERARTWEDDPGVTAFENEVPQRRMLMPAFYLGVYAVTNLQFTRFLNDVHPSPAQISQWMPKLERIITPDDATGAFGVADGYENHPVVHVSWFGADEYCRWAGLRLPREPEWEKGARGTDGRIFPWGDQWCDECVQGSAAASGDAGTAPVEAHPSGCSPFGLFQMAGNVEEWCADPYRDDALHEYAAHGVKSGDAAGHRFAVRGGSCVSRFRRDLRCASRRAVAPVSVVRACIGFRCACGELRWMHVPTLDSAARNRPAQSAHDAVVAFDSVVTTASS